MRNNVDHLHELRKHEVLSSFRSSSLESERNPCNWADGQIASRGVKSDARWWDNVFEALGVAAAHDLQNEVEQLREEARSLFGRSI